MEVKVVERNAGGHDQKDGHRPKGLFSLDVHSGVLLTANAASQTLLEQVRDIRVRAAEFVSYLLSGG